MAVERILLASLWILAAGCAPPRRAALGGECVRNSECNAPLVCRIGFCRNECATSADCPVGLSCLLDGAPHDAHRFGACQLTEEATCTLASECPEGLVCRFGQCTNACEGDRDCPGGASCRVGPMGNACVDASTTPCTLDSECAGGEFCLSGRCRRQCYADRDCRRGWWCDDGTCRDPSVDGGSRDAGLDAPEDTGTEPDVPEDAGPIDGGPPSVCPGGRLENVVALEVADTLTCAAYGVPATRVACWGQVEFGGMLFGGPMMQPCARSFELGTAIDALAVVDSTACVLSAGTVRCWGSDTYGALGRGPGDDATATPTVVSGLGTVRAISGSMLSTFWAWSGAAGFGWGRSDSGSIGDGSTGAMVANHTPVPLSWPFPVLAIDGGPTATGVILDEAGTRTWRMFGRPFTATFPYTFPVITGAIDATVGNAFACALTATGVSCWGQGYSGELGDGMLHASDTPVTVVGLPGVPVELDAGAGHVCARMADGEVWCWGYDTGFSSIAAPMARSTPVRVFESAVEVEGGYEHTCIRTTSGTVHCIGRGGSGYGIGEGVRLGPPGSASEVHLE